MPISMYRPACLGCFVASMRDRHIIQGTKWSEKSRPKNSVPQMRGASTPQTGHVALMSKLPPTAEERARAGTARGQYTSHALESFRPRTLGRYADRYRTRTALIPRHTAAPRSTGTMIRSSVKRIWGRWVSLATPEAMAIQTTGGMVGGGGGGGGAWGKETNEHGAVFPMVGDHALSIDARAIYMT